MSLRVCGLIRSLVYIGRGNGPKTQLGLESFHLTSCLTKNLPRIHLLNAVK